MPAFQTIEIAKLEENDNDDDKELEDFCSLEDFSNMTAPQHKKILKLETDDDKFEINNTNKLEELYLLNKNNVMECMEGNY